MSRFIIIIVIILFIIIIYCNCMQILFSIRLDHSKEIKRIYTGCATLASVKGPGVR